MDSHGRHTNLALAWLVAAAFVSGWVAFAAGTPSGAWVVVAHGIVGLGVVALAPWKAVIARRGLRRRRPGRAMSVALTIFAGGTVISGLALTTGVVDRVGPLTTMQIHVGAAVAALVATALHFRRRPVTRRPDPARRRFLRDAGLAVGATVLWGSWELGLGGLSLPGAGRRFTGSHERGSHRPEAMPVTQWLDDRVPRLDPSRWRLDVAGEQFDLAALDSRANEEVTATIDCTGGWFATQTWRGVRLDRLLDPGDAHSVVVWSETGYARRFPVSELDRLWLAVSYEGDQLRNGHGFPARLVAPGRRGFWWVKWVVRIQPSSLPWWVQSPFPLT